MRSKFYIFSLILFIIVSICFVGLFNMSLFNNSDIKYFKDEYKNYSIKKSKETSSMNAYYSSLYNMDEYYENYEGYDYDYEWNSSIHYYDLGVSSSRTY